MDKLLKPIRESGNAAAIAALDALGASPTDAQVQAVHESLSPPAPARAPSPVKAVLRWIAEAVADLSLDDKIDKVASAVRATYGSDGLVSQYAYARATFDDYVIIKKCGKDGDQLYRVSYHFDADGSVVFDGDPVEQVQVYQDAPLTESVSGTQRTDRSFREGRIFGPVLEAGETKSTGKKWGVLIIQEGMSANRNRYKRKVLQDAAPLYEGKKIYLDHDDQGRYGRSTEQVAGFLKDVQPVVLTTKEATGGSTLALAATAVVTKASVRQELLDAYAEGNADLFGLSHDVLAESVTVMSADGPFYDVTRIESVRSVDFVTNPAAGGRVLRLVASATTPHTLEGDGRMLKKMIEAIKARGTAAAKAKLEALGAEPTEDQVLAVYEAAFTEVKEAVIPPTPAAVVDPAKKVEVKESEWNAMTGHLLESRKDGATMFLETSLAGTSLPDVIKDKVRKACTKGITEAKAVDALPTREAITETIKEEVEAWGKMAEKGIVVPGAGGSGRSVQLGDGPRENIDKRMDAFFGIKREGTGDAQKVVIDHGARAVSFRQLYIDVTGDTGITGDVKECKRLTEALSSSSFDQILGDSITRRMLAEYAQGDKANWRGTIAEVVPVTDFRTQRRMRFGGYGNLTTVAQGQAYPSMTSPTDEEATYAPAKRGGTEQLTIEMIANDDVGAVRRIPTRLANAARQTLYEFVWDFLANNSAIYDSVALAASGHGTNISTTALSSSQLTAARLAMKKQTDMSNSKRIGLAAKYLIVPTDLEELAFQLTTSDRMLPDSSLASTANPAAPSFIRKLGITPITVDYWTDANNWWVTADPSQTPMIEIGFWGGREEPELFVQDTPTMGSLFSNDVITYKIRHVYGGGVLDFRGFFGGIVA